MRKFLKLTLFTINKSLWANRFCLVLFIICLTLIFQRRNKWYPKVLTRPTTRCFWVPMFRTYLHGLNHVPLYRLTYKKCLYQCSNDCQPVKENRRRCYLGKFPSRWFKLWRIKLQDFSVPNAIAVIQLSVVYPNINNFIVVRNWNDNSAASFATRNIHL